MLNTATLLVLFSAASAALAGAIHGRDDHCGGDNCARQVTGTRAGLFPIESRRADCSSFMRATVEPDATTTTVTVTAGDYRRDVEPQAVTQTPAVMPTYASSCRATSNYSSACSCWGITAVTSTATRATQTTTVTVTSEPCPYT